ncbi:hypothetical protein TIFTF001_041449 [Ficus carica]|uniref:Uncharacterized protein n=1 Tax=Ficus carica TaxID=3494 RepID=A0AA87Z7M9_FICCA|nr:hypothetical protein TIFTF001_041449 [Ficus carica]
MFLPILRTNGIAYTTTSLVVLLLRVVSLLALIVNISLPFVAPGWLVILIRITSLALRVKILILLGLRLLHHSPFFFLGSENLSLCFLVLVDPILCSYSSTYTISYNGWKATTSTHLLSNICAKHLHHSPYVPRCIRNEFPT